MFDWLQNILNYGHGAWWQFGRANHRHSPSKFDKKKNYPIYCIREKACNSYAFLLSAAGSFCLLGFRWQDCEFEFGVSMIDTDNTLNLNWGENKQFTALRIPITLNHFRRNYRWW